MPLHPEYDAMLKQLAATPGPALSDMPVADARAMYRMMRPASAGSGGGEGAGQIDSRSGRRDSDAHLHTGRQRSVPDLRLFPRRRLGDRRSRDGRCDLRASSASGSVVSSCRWIIGSRLNIDFPAAVDDSFAATKWVAENAKALNGDASRLAVGGESAGGNLAAVVSHLARDRNGPAIAYQLLAYPVTGADFTPASYRANADGYLLTLAGMQWFWNTYLPNAAERTNPMATPLNAKNFAKLPRALIMTAEFDPLRDEGEAYANKLKAAGVPVDYVRFDGLIHDFLAMSRQLSAVKPAMDKAVAGLRNVFGR